MHRQIHSVYTLGFLADADARKLPAFADPTLWTQVAIAVNADGHVDHVEVLRTSGLQAFDGAVVDSVQAAAPFPPPPDAIKSSDGRVHLDWQFHRDERSCGTFGVDPHVYGPDGTEDKGWRDGRALKKFYAELVAGRRQRCRRFQVAHVSRDAGRDGQAPDGGQVGHEVCDGPRRRHVDHAAPREIERGLARVRAQSRIAGTFGIAARTVARRQEQLRSRV